jgi:uncharacterized protein (UPF0548 family)
VFFSLRRPSPAALSRLVREQGAEELSYPEVGATAAVLPGGYLHDHRQVDLGGFDADRFALAAKALRRWQAQLGAGLTIFPGTEVKPDATFALVVPLPVGFATAAGRVVYVIDKPEHYGFAYGTLPAHPEQGEEAFHVVRDGDRLVFRVVTFSRPRHPVARAGAPMTRFLQNRTIALYLSAMRQAALRDPP